MEPQYTGKILLPTQIKAIRCAHTFIEIHLETPKSGDIKNEVFTVKSQSKILSDSPPQKRIGNDDLSEKALKTLCHSKGYHGCKSFLWKYLITKERMNTIFKENSTNFPFC